MDTLKLVAQHDGRTRHFPQDAPYYPDKQTVNNSLIIREVDVADAPVAARSPIGFFFHYGPALQTDIRLVGGSFFRVVQFNDGYPVTMSNARLSATGGGLFCGVFETEQDAKDATELRAANLILIDGVLWQRIPEPLYEIRSDGQVYPVLEPSPARLLFPLTRFEDAVLAAKVSPGNHLRKPDRQVDLLIPEAFSQPAPSDVARAKADAATATRSVLEPLSDPTSSDLRVAAMELLKLAREYDTAILPGEAKSGF